MGATTKNPIRRMRPEEIDQVVSIEWDSFHRPWTSTYIRKLITKQNSTPYVYEERGRVVGWTIYQIIRPTLLVLRLAVSPDARRRGIGTRLVLSLQGKTLRSRSCRKISVPVAQCDLIPQCFFRKSGFIVTEVLSRAEIEETYGYTTEDHYLFEWFR